MELPPQNDEAGDPIPMDPQVEARLAPMLAQAAQRLLQQNQGQAQQQQAQQQAQDPIIQMQQQELQLKQQEQQRKAAKDQADNQLDMQRLQLEQKRIETQAQTAAAQQKNDLLKSAAQMSATRKQNLMNTGVDVLKHMSDQSHSNGQQDATHSHQKDQATEQLISKNVHAALAKKIPPTKGK